MAALLQNQAMLVQNQVAFVGRMSAIEQRLGRIEAILTQHSQLLDTLNDRVREIIETLPDRIGAKFGFQPPQRERPAE
jgi:hypothetical protein